MKREFELNGKKFTVETNGAGGLNIRIPEGPIVDIFVFPNANVACFDDNGFPIPKVSGCLVELLEQAIATKTGDDFEALLMEKIAEREQRHRALCELAEQAQELGMGYELDTKDRQDEK